MRIPELLAPAGSIETFRAALTAGADAVYLGCGDFNARKRAKNFTGEELRLAVEYAHVLGRKIYITLNTLVFEHEFPALLEFLELLREVRADAVIVQDIGVLSLVREFFPEIPLHASTQMFCHNSLHARFLREQGVTRLILPRELSLAEIGAMMGKVPAEYEVFVHGAMCFSFSGCCLASSWLHGDSGNRGRCRQVCRHAFREADSGRQTYPFSMKDLNARGFLTEISRLGVTSLKIEGRLKNTEYVSEVVSAYRAALDAIRDGNADREIRAVSRQRETESGYFSGDREYHRLVQHGESGTAGEAIGGAVSVSGTEIRMKLTGKPVRGTRLRVQDARGRNIHEGALIEFFRDRDAIVWRTKEPVSDAGYVPPFTVYAVGKSAPADALGFLRGAVRKTTVDRITVDAVITSGGIRIRAAFAGLPVPFEGGYPLATQESRTRPLVPEECVRVIREAGNSPFAVGDIRCRVEGNLFCPAGELKNARRAFYRDLEAFHAARTKEAAGHRRDALARKLAAIRERRVTATPPGIFLRADARPSRDDGTPEFTACPVDLEIFPATPPAETVLILPHFVPETAVDAWERRLRELVRAGYTRFIAPSYGWLSLREELPGAEFIAGPYLYAVNPPAIDLLERNGVHSFVLSPDIRMEDAGSTARFSGRLVCANAPREMFVTRLRIPPGAYTIKGRTFRPRYFADYTVIEEA